MMVVFTVDANGVQDVTTHGGTALQAAMAADAGNRLKEALAWPAETCRAVPLRRICSNCEHFACEDTSHARGRCQLNPEQVTVSRLQRCSHFEPNC